MSEAALDHDRHPQEDQAADYGLAYQPAQESTPVGAVLAARRMEGQWSVEQVAHALKLAPRQVEALEAGDYGALPGMAVARGFIRSYAKLMRIDVEPYMSTVIGSAALNAMPPSRKPLTAVPFSEKQTGSLMGGGARNSSRLLMGSGVLLTVLVLASALVAVQRAGWLTSARDSLLSSGGKAMAMISARPGTTVAEDAASARLGGMNMTLGEQGVLASAGAPIATSSPGSPDAAAVSNNAGSTTAGASSMPTLTVSPMLNLRPADAATATGSDTGNAAAPGAKSASPSTNHTATTPGGGSNAATMAAPAPAVASKPALPLIQPVSPGPQTDEAAAQTPVATVSKFSSALNGAASGSTGSAGGVLSLVMHEDSWVEIRRADRSTMVSRMFKAGSAEAFTLDGPVSMLVGNAHGVDATLRGTPVELKANSNNTARVNLK